MSRFTFELRRKFFHVVSLIHLLLYYIILKQFNSQTYALFYLVSILILFLIMEYFRIMKNKKIPLFQKLWRNKESNKLGGEVYYMLGMIVALAFFDFKIALAAILMMGIGDAAATVIGTKFGKHKFSEHSSIQGTFSELLINLAIGFFILNSWSLAIAMALTATLAEIFTGKINDNLTIPILVGLVGQILINFFL